MSAVSTLIQFLVMASFLFFAIRRLMTYMHVFQQEEYDSTRFVKWLWTKKTFDKRLTFLLLIIGAASVYKPQLDTLWNIALCASFIAMSLREKDPRKHAKKALVITARAKRILIFSIVYTGLLGIFGYYLDTALYWLFPVQMLPFILVIATLSLKPHEDMIQQEFWDEAHEKLKELNPIVVGVTGSFGKTSVKHILGHILQNTAPALITPGSVNTPMGITRIIREQLTDRHKYFVVEMGAYGPGSIDRLCRLAPPQIGVITAIGHAHYERFKSLDTVANTKFELAEHVTQANGTMIIRDETLRYETPKALYDVAPNLFIVCGKDDEHGLQIKNIEQAKTGLRVEITWQGQDYTLEAPLYGLHHGYNMALAFTTACVMGIDPQFIVTALKTTPQISHRLEVKAQGNGYLIDDAYNSNPRGFRSALDVLDLLGKDSRRILITPGMVELGKSHDEQHKKLGTYAAGKADIVLAVNAIRIDTFVDSFKENANESQILIEVKNFAEAQEWLQKNGKDGDAILLENDLPDLYETKLKL